MPKSLILPIDHPLLRTEHGVPLNQDGITRFMNGVGRERENKPYFGVGKESNGDEYLIVGYFKNLAERRIIDFRKIDADDFATYFNNNLDKVAEQLVNVVLIGIGGTITYEKVTVARLENDSLAVRKEAIAKIKDLAIHHKHLKIDLFIHFTEEIQEKYTMSLLYDWLKKKFAIARIEDVFNKVYIIKNINSINNILYATANQPAITGVANVFVVNNPDYNCPNPIKTKLPDGHIINASLSNEAHWDLLQNCLLENKINPLLLYLSAENNNNATESESSS